ncbi:MAG: 30S ribosomal protein S18 [Acidobacteria bacterium]|nr:30S ribosomal protein S18 [Acidobacteriota bacterium]
MAENQGTTGGGQTGGAGRPGGPGGGAGGPRGDRGGDRGGPRRGGPGGRREGGGGGRRFFRRRKVCKFCVEKVDHIDYKEVKVIGQFVNERGKILPRRVTGVCTSHQRGLKVAVTRARNIALLPFQARI